ncbi:unnamed protein product [Fusarium graminearum]|uniref:Uncharacterized protein n=1 Tax=Gibberella zeae TaxID=5518 RepID=A0A9N8R777_GIBZA|nr:unnamed protein product [Fusarium graminearum]
MTGASILYFSALAFTTYLIFKYLQQRSKEPLPPGPKGLPLLGNVLDLPPPGTIEWIHWQKHKEKYGPISSVSVLGQLFVILHDKQTIMDLLETRSLKSASRPKLIFAGDVVGYDSIMGMMPYDRTFRLHRKLTATQVSGKSIGRFEPIQELEISRLLKRIYNDHNSDNLPEHLNQVSGSIMLRILYNYETDPNKNDHIVSMANTVMEEFSKATSPGAWAVDLVPWLKYLPEWIPGAGFKKTAKVFRDHLLQNVKDPYNYVRDQMARGNDHVSYVAGLVEDIHRKIDPEEESVIQWTAASMMNAGTDTTGATLLSFFAAMVIYPDVQKRAQEEIDRVVGHSRLPSFADKANLPYINSIAQEALRWHTLAPMGFPHMTTENDIYKGYFIPKNILLFPAVASITHDPDVYHDPMAFKPERYSEPYSEPSPADVVFGFGPKQSTAAWHSPPSGVGSSTDINQLPTQHVLSSTMSKQTCDVCGTFLSSAPDTDAQKCLGHVRLARCRPDESFATLTVGYPVNGEFTVPEDVTARISLRESGPGLEQHPDDRVSLLDIFHEPCWNMLLDYWLGHPREPNSRHLINQPETIPCIVPGQPTLGFNMYFGGLDGSWLPRLIQVSVLTTPNTDVLQGLGFYYTDESCSRPYHEIRFLLNGPEGERINALVLEKFNDEVDLKTITNFHRVFKVSQADKEKEARLKGQIYKPLIKRTEVPDGLTLVAILATVKLSVSHETIETLGTSCIQDQRSTSLGPNRHQGEPLAITLPRWERTVNTCPSDISMTMVRLEGIKRIGISTATFGKTPAQRYISGLCFEFWDTIPLIYLGYFYKQHDYLNLEDGDEIQDIKCWCVHGRIVGIRIVKSGSGVTSVEVHGNEMSDELCNEPSLIFTVTQLEQLATLTWKCSVAGNFMTVKKQPRDPLEERLVSDFDAADFDIAVSVTSEELFWEIEDSKAMVRAVTHIHTYFHAIGKQSLCGFEFGYEDCMLMSVGCTSGIKNSLVLEAGERVTCVATKISRSYFLHNEFDKVVFHTTAAREITLSPSGCRTRELVPAPSMDDILAQVLAGTEVPSGEATQNPTVQEPESPVLPECHWLSAQAYDEPTYGEDEYRKVCQAVQSKSKRPSVGMYVEMTYHPTKERREVMKAVPLFFAPCT